MGEKIIILAKLQFGSTFSFVFKQDIFGTHRVIPVALRKDENGANVMKCSAQSLYLNRIQNSWELLKTRIRERPANAHNADHLFETIWEEWFYILNCYFLSFINCMKSRAGEMKTNKGESITY